MTALPALDTAIAALNSGADRYVIKGHSLVDQLRLAVHEVSESLKWKKEAGYLRRELRRLTGLDNIIGQSPNMRAIFDMIQTVAPQTSRVLITGKVGPAKNWLPAPFMKTAFGHRPLLSPSTVVRSRRLSWSPNFSVI